MLTIHNLTLKYGTHVVLSDLNLDLESGFVHGLVGLNGAGKTTLLNAIYGLIKKDEGRILYHGSCIKKKDISFLQTDSYFYSSITGKEYLDLFLYYNPKFNVLPLLDLFQLPLNQLIDSYSTGMKKKLAILACLILDKSIIILDEPFNGLDVESVYVLTHLIKKLNHTGRIVIVTSHIINSLTPICDQIHYLHAGAIQHSYHSAEFDDLVSLIEGNLFDKYKGIDEMGF